MGGSFRVGKVSCPSVKGRLALAAVAGAAATLAAPALAEAAAVGLLQPQKACYRSGEQVGVGGSGYTPNTGVTITADGQALRSGPTADPNGNFAGNLTVGQRRGSKLKTYAFTDQSNPANTAALPPLRVSALSVTLRPRNGRPNRLFRIRARGFTTGSRLYAHVVRRGYRRNIRLGRLRGACHTLATRRRLFTSGLPTGIYTVQFDSRRRYSRGTRVKVRRRFQIFRRFG
jgi:hypothetical protein